MTKRLTVVLLCLCLTLAAHAQEDSLRATRYVMRSTLFGVGHNNLFETYLTPLEYTGIEARFLHERMRMTRIMGGKVSTQSIIQAHASMTENPAGNADMYAGLVSWSYALHYQFRLNRHFKILAGPILDLNGGVVYNRRNSNNPAQAKAYGSVGASGMAVYKFRIGKCPLTLRYQADLPLLGAMFSPEFGESYYEIFSLGHGGRHVVFTSLHNSPSLRQMLTLDFPAGSTVIRAGYVCDIRQAEANNLKSHSYSHCFMIGFVRNMYMLRGKNKISMPEKSTPF